MNAPPTPFALHRHRRRSAALLFLLPGVTLLPQSAQASLFKGEALDSVANGMSWAVLVIAPIIGIGVFWLVHILPEKIAHKRKHPQTRLIQCLCLMSLVFGGILWPLAWILAYSKPVLHKLAYGTDVDESLAHHDNDHDHDQGEAVTEETSEVERLRLRIAQLERQITGGQS
jgi:CBS domain containing-hemolysin-like protein